MTKIQLLDALKLYDAAALKFIKKVESGNARSHVTYAELKAALDFSLFVQTQNPRGLK